MASVFKLRGRWQVEFKDAAGKLRRKSTKTSDKGQALLLAARLEAGELELDNRAYKDHVEDYRKHLELAGRVEHHVRDTQRQLLLLDANVLAQMTPAAVEQVLAARKAKSSARTLNKLRTCFLSFARWCVKTGRIERQRLDVVPRQNEVEKQRGRRALTAAELDRLFQLAPWGSFYRFAFLTGLRRSEIERLEWKDVDLALGQIIVRGGKAKHRIDVIPLHDALRNELVQQQPSPLVGRVFSTIPTDAERRADFQRAGIETSNQTARADLHSLRVSLGTTLARSGVPLPVTQRLLRHSTPVLTAASYVKLLDADLVQGLAAIPGRGTLTSLRTVDRNVSESVSDRAHDVRLLPRSRGGGTADAVDSKSRSTGSNGQTDSASVSELDHVVASWSSLDPKIRSLILQLVELNGPASQPASA